MGLTPTDNIVDCKTWASAAYPLQSTPGTGYLPWKTTEINVPIDERDLFVFARGSSFSGIARVHESPDVKDLKVSVSARFRNEEALSGTRVCLVERESGAHGVAILVRHTFRPSTHMGCNRAGRNSRRRQGGFRRRRSSFSQSTLPYRLLDTAYRTSQASPSMCRISS